jgi:metacaspase-1
MNYSLHIGLNRVSPAAYGGWGGKLSGCHNDADAMAAIAIARGARCNILLSQDATLQRVIDAIYVISQDAKPGETVLITYSGHGGQVPDLSHDENDGFDETWCLYDGMLIDDDLNAMLAHFRKGVRVIVVSDSCHSGTVTKATAMLENSKLIGVRKIVKAAPAEACRVAPRSSSPLAQALAKKPRMKASIVLLSGCQDNQFSYDGPTNGLFTEKLLKVYADGKLHYSYREFRKQIGRLMPPEQTPQIYIIGGKNKPFEAGPVFQ